jgi:hypothetical protein
MASPEEVGGGGDLDIDEGIPARGVFGWDSSAGRWIRQVASSLGFAIVEARQATANLLNCTEASAATILTNVVNILTQATTINTSTATTATQTTEIADAVEDHDVAAIADDQAG